MNMNSYMFDSEMVDFISRKDMLPFLKVSPFYKLNPWIRKGNIGYNYTLEELIQMEQMKDIFNLVKILKIKEKPIELYSFQEKFLQILNGTRFIDLQSSRQMGISTMLSIFLLHYLLNNSEKEIVILVDKLQQGKEFIDQIKYFYYQLPFFLKKGVLNWNDSSIKFENGTRIKCININKQDICLGYTVHCLVLSDLISIDPNIIGYLIPTIFSHNDSRIICHVIGKNSLNFIKDNDNFTHLKYLYTEIPSRDQEWKEEMIKMIGKEMFQQEYELLDPKKSEEN